MELTSAETQARKLHETIDLSRACADWYTYCDTCETSYDTADSTDCPTCGRAPRCDKTIDLPFVAPECWRLSTWMGTAALYRLGGFWRIVSIVEIVPIVSRRDKPRQCQRRDRAVQRPSTFARSVSSQVRPSVSVPYCP